MDGLESGKLFPRQNNTQSRFTLKSQKFGVCVCVLLTVSLFMKPQIAAATSQAKRITKKKKN